MEYVTPIGAEDPDASYVNANPGADVEGSPVLAEAIEFPMREIVAVIKAAGLPPNNADLTQLLQAVLKLISGAVSASITPNGYMVFPVKKVDGTYGQVILQWGRGIFTGAGGNIQTVSFPIAFPTNMLQGFVSNASATGAGGSAVFPVVSVTASTKTTMSVQQVTSNAMGTYFSWFALGN